MARFESKQIKIMDADGEEREYTVIKDRSTFTKVETPFGELVDGRGFIRCHGKQYWATYGLATPVYVGDEDDTYYAPVHYFDGTWYHTGADARGLHHNVTARSGSGQLFAELEEFANANAVPVCG